MAITKEKQLEIRLIEKGSAIILWVSHGSCAIPLSFLLKNGSLRSVPQLDIQGTGQPKLFPHPGSHRAQEGRVPNSPLASGREKPDSKFRTTAWHGLCKKERRAWPYYSRCNRLPPLVQSDMSPLLQVAYPSFGGQEKAESLVLFKNTPLILQLTKPGDFYSRASQPDLVSDRMYCKIWRQELPPKSPRLYAKFSVQPQI